jgi:hypothetical protein
MSSTPDTAGPNSEPCYLLRIATELQLAIYELVVIQDEPLLLNLPCNSSYRMRWQEMAVDEAAWERGDKHPPLQPALSRTCRAIRHATLPIFYQHNVFRASYCYQQKMLPVPIKWLRIIGPANREMLRHLYFYDRNEDQDGNRCGDLEAVKACEIFGDMGGRMEMLSNAHCCAHLVVFGNHVRRAREVPLAAQPGAKRLRLTGEL